jgi:multimeric flavodoxin WrbA
MKVVAIGGSPRTNGNTNYLIDQALQELGSLGIETEKIILNEYKISPCQGHDECASFVECRLQDDAPWILEKLRQADGLILASPVYCNTFTAQMKTLQDRTYFAYTHNLARRATCAGLIAVGEAWGVEETIEALKGLLGPSKIKTFTLTGYAAKVDDMKNQPDMVLRARDMARQMANTLSA